ncbi:hypothetical protein L7H23_01300 [Sphingopyxis sp. BSN-002]|uniref:hypothetical protein n=1 Tax=Sphingopyxis sp. BSN-002 TaxID=2911495 RepID=UPI001EDB818D|nr:hypothetical protein [Sphingopyxis sp. BSN-002]UKK84769.1 hypothetical protein L7H23_01300 [Sphingopyxis sp. BSN-002]
MSERDAVAKIIDPDAWHETLPTDGCGAYWVGRRNKARERAKAIAAAMVAPAANSEFVQRLRDEADLCAKDGADDVFELLHGAIDEIERLTAVVARAIRHAQNIGIDSGSYYESLVAALNGER